MFICRLSILLLIVGSQVAFGIRALVEPVHVIMCRKFLLAVWALEFDLCLCVHLACLILHLRGCQGVLVAQRASIWLRNVQIAVLAADDVGLFETLIVLPVAAGEEES